MTVSAARAAAFEVLLRVEKEDAYASELLHASRFDHLSRVDHALLTELVMGVLRWRATLDAALAQLTAQPLRKFDAEVLIALRMGAYQLLYLDRIPARAAVHESVELVRQARKASAVPLVNAVLRRLTKPAQKAAEEREGSAEERAVHFSHPEWMVERWVTQFGSEKTALICETNQQVPQAAAHISAKTSVNLSRDGITLAPGKLLRSACRVASGEITHSSALRDGGIVIQDEGSQLVALLIGSATPPAMRILDCCAAPGGKTLILAERNPEAAITAVELHPHRARVLEERLAQFKNVEVLTGDIRTLPLSDQFDRILVDAPCSGTGTLAHHPEIKWRLAPEAITRLQELQVSILRSAMRHLASGGQLLYATCSLEREENEDVVAQAMNRDAEEFHVLDLRITIAELQKSGELLWPDIESLLSGPFLRTVPGVHPCDGFFAALVSRK